jgi:SecD/SecF fusion protein
MSIIKHRSIFLGIAAVLIVASAIVISTKGFRLGAEFTGGSLVGISQDAYQVSEVKDALSSDEVVVVPVDDKVFEVRVSGEEMNPEIVTEITKLYPDSKVVYETTIGPSLGRELARKSTIALVMVLLAILVFVAYAFGGINEARSKFNLGPNSWIYGLSTLLALMHDVLIPTAIFALLGKEITSLYVVGMLSILGLSVSDTIVVFDRIRERMRTAKEGETFKHLVDSSIADTMTRSLNTSVVLMLVLGALLVFGPTATHDLALVMLLGAFFGTYSSIFVASPLLTLFTSKKKSAK